MRIIELLTSLEGRKKGREILIEKAKASKFSMEEISNGTFTLSNLGMLGVRNFTAVINPP